MSGERPAASAMARAAVRHGCVRCCTTRRHVEAERAFVVEGPRAIEAALDRGAPLEAVFFGTNADVAFAPLTTRVENAGVPDRAPQGRRARAARFHGHAPTGARGRADAVAVDRRVGVRRTGARRRRARRSRERRHAAAERGGVGRGGNRAERRIGRCLQSQSRSRLRRRDLRNSRPRGVVGGGGARRVGPAGPAAVGRRRPHRHSLRRRSTSRSPPRSSSATRRTACRPISTPISTAASRCRCTGPRSRSTCAMAGVVLCFESARQRARTGSTMTRSPSSSRCSTSPTPRIGEARPRSTTSTAAERALTGRGSPMARANEAIKDLDAG